MLNMKKRPALFSMFVAMLIASLGIFVASGIVPTLAFTASGMAALSLVHGGMRDAERLHQNKA